MAANLFKEKMEYLGARFNTFEGIFEFLIGSTIWGFIIVQYKDYIFNSIVDFLSFLPETIVYYLSYMAFGLVLLPLSILITYFLTIIYKKLFGRNRRIF